MNTLVALALSCSVLSLVVVAKPDQQGQEELLFKATARRDAELELREAQYHKQLHLYQEKLVASKRASTASLKVTPTDPGDRAAVIALYQSTNGPKWFNNTGWLKGDPCTLPWYGLYCINGRVLQINLVYNGLSGPIPSQLTQATALQVIRLYSNMITGEIPPGLFGIQSLQIIDFNTNSINGTLPSRISMASLTQLSLYANQIGSAFPEDFDTPMLQLLEVSSNMFSGVLPEGLSNSPNLTDLVVSRNMLSGTFPSSYSKCVNLQRLWTFYNLFGNPRIPDEYQSMTDMTEVQADGLSGEIPTWIGTSWSKLQYLILINGKITGSIPNSICSLREVSGVRFFNNSLSGELPDCLCDMEKLVDFEVSDNELTGKIPDLFGNCKMLQNFYVSRNNLTGMFPSSLGYLTNIVIIDVSSNGLYGTIPNTINNLKDSIAEFAICFNMFSGVENGMDDFFNRIKDYSCLFYNNPWSCPLSTTIPKECSATCSQCNLEKNHGSCSVCVGVTGCGWCETGDNCLEGSSSAAGEYYQCSAGDWKFGGC